MTNRLFDCAVIGGGLAGLTLAIQLAEAGNDVVLFEKEKYPFHKVCGEYVAMESFDFLQRIGIPLSTMNLPVIDEVKVSSPDGSALIRKLNPGGFGISRFTLDSELAKLALSKGVTLLEETKVTDLVFENNQFSILAGQEKYRSKLVCGAYGKRPFSSKKDVPDEYKRKGKNYMAVKYHVRLEFPANRIELHNFKNGYCGISKVDGERYCLCYMTDSQNLRDNGNDIKRMELNVLMKNPFLKKYFSEAVFLYEKPITISQLSFTKKKPVVNHTLMLGDAAGNIAPLCGNGMSMAMHASFMAFKIIRQFLNLNVTREELERVYENQWNSVFSGRIRAGNVIQSLFGKEKVTNISIGALKNIPLLTDKIINLTHGRPF